MEESAVEIGRLGKTGRYMGLCCGLCYYGAGRHYTGPLLGVTVYGSYCNQHPSTDPALGKKRVLAEVNI